MRKTIRLQLLIEHIILLLTIGTAFILYLLQLDVENCQLVESFTKANRK